MKEDERKGGELSGHHTAAKKRMYAKSARERGV